MEDNLLKVFFAAIVLHRRDSRCSTHESDCR
jgi:hypothetical protein